MTYTMKLANLNGQLDEQICPSSFSFDDWIASTRQYVFDLIQECDVQGVAMYNKYNIGSWIYPTLDKSNPVHFKPGQLVVSIEGSKVKEWRFIPAEKQDSLSAKVVEEIEALF